MSLTVTFELGRDPDIATVNVNNRVAVAEPRLPEEVRRFGITVRKQSPDLTLVVNLLSPDGSRDALFLSNYALINVLDALKRVPGVGDVGIFGERRYAMRIWLDPERLAKLGLTAADVVAAVREQNVQIAAGRAGSPPAPDGQQLELPLRTKGRLSTVEEFEQIVIRAEPDGSLLRLGDVARVELGAQSYAGFTRLIGPADDDARRLPAPRGERARRLARRCAPSSTRLAESFPSGVALDGALRPDALRRRVDRARCSATLAEAMLLVFLVVYVFLQDWRTTLIPAVTIPVSLIGTFAVLYAIGLVDQHHHALRAGARDRPRGRRRDRGGRERRAPARRRATRAARRCVRSMGEVTSAIVAATLVLGAVFVPVALPARHDRACCCASSASR